MADVFCGTQHSSTPLRHSVLLKATGQPHPISASPTTPSFSLSTSMSTPTLSQLARTRARSEESGVRLSPVTGRPVLGRTPRKYGGPGMGSVGGSPAHVRSSVAQIVSGKSPVQIRGDGGRFLMLCYRSEHIWRIINLKPSTATYYQQVESCKAI